MDTQIMRRCPAWLLVFALLCQLAATLSAGVYRLEDGSTIRGEPAGFDDYGMTFRLETGGFSQRYNWGKFTQESLKLLATDPKVFPMVDPFIEIPPEDRPKPKPVVLKEVPRVDRPSGRMSLLSSATTPAGLTIIVLLYLANLFAAYEIARYRNRPVALVCGLSALLPVVVPLIFVASPTLVPESDPDAMESVVVPPAGPGVATVGSAGGATSRRVGKPAPPAGGGLRVVAEVQAAASERAQPKVYGRNDYTFNRRFVETQFSSFFRVVPAEADKDLVLVVKTPKAEYIGKRISRISANELFLQLLQDGKEMNISFGEIAQVIVRHKDHG